MNEFAPINFEDGDILFKSNDPADCFYMIESGQISIFDPKRNVEIALLSVGDCFGEQALLKGGVRAATAKAVGKTACIKLSVKNVRKLMAESTGIVAPMLEALFLQLSLHNGLETAPG